MFSTCSPIRPNPIGMSVVEVLGIRDANLDARRLDMLDGTPMLDIKPQLHSCCTPLYAVMLGTAHMGSAVYVRISSCCLVCVRDTSGQDLKCFLEGMNHIGKSRIYGKHRKVGYV